MTNVTPTENESEKLTEDSWWLLVNCVDWLTTKADLPIYMTNPCYFLLLDICTTLK